MEPVPESTKFDYEGRCWWCGNEADSREHKWKKSELAALYGTPDSENYPLTWIDSEGVLRSIQGPNSALVKFEKSLCQNCNGARSQPFDRAYDLWIKYVVANYDQILELGFVDLRNVVELEQFEKFQLNLARYFAKHICCRVADGDAAKVPDSAIAFLDGESNDSSFAWTELCLSSSALEQHEVTRNRLGMSETVGCFRQDGTALTSLKGALMHGALQLVWDISLDPSRADSGNGILVSNVHTLREVGDDLYSHRFITVFSDDISMENPRQ